MDPRPRACLGMTPTVRRKLGPAADRFLFGATLFVLLLFFLFRRAWMVLSSPKTSAQVPAFPPLWLFWPTVQNYVDVFEKNPFISYMVNSTVVAVLAVGVGLLCGLPAAYTMARYRQS